MAALVLPQRITIQPKYSSTIDKSNSLTQGLIVLVNAAQGSGGISGASWINLASGIPLTYALSGSTQFLGTMAQNNGLCIDFVASHTLATETLANIGTGDYTDFWYGYPMETALGTTRACFLIGSDNNLTGITQFGGSNNGAGSTSVDSLETWASSWLTSGFVAPLGSPLVVVNSRKNGVQSLYINGLFYTSKASTTNIGAQKLIFGSFLPANTFWSNTNRTLLGGRFNRGLSAAEALSLCANPWQLFSPRLI